MKTNDKFDAQSWKSIYDEPVNKSKFEEDVEKACESFEQEKSNIKSVTSSKINTNKVQSFDYNDEKKEKNSSKDKKKSKIKTLVGVAFPAVILLGLVIVGVIYHISM